EAANSRRPLSVPAMPAITGAPAAGIPVTHVTPANPVAAPIAAHIGAVIGGIAAVVAVTGRRIVSRIDRYAETHADHDARLGRRCSGNNGAACRGDGERSSRNFSERFHDCLGSPWMPLGLRSSARADEPILKTPGMDRSCAQAERPRASIRQISDTVSPRTQW